MDINNLPDLKSNVLSERYTLCVTPQMKRDLDELKNIKNKDVSEALRRLISSWLDDVKKAISL